MRPQFRLAAAAGLAAQAGRRLGQADRRPQLAKQELHLQHLMVAADPAPGRQTGGGLQQFSQGNVSLT